MERVAVVGAGTMGNGIAHVMAKAGLAVTMIDADAAALGRARAAIEKNLGREVKKGVIDEAAARHALGRIVPAAALEAAAEAELIVEAVPERRELKRDIFATLDRIAAPEAILASNTSSISITDLAAVTGRPGRVIGMHFMNPVPVMTLVEIIRGLATAPETVDSVRGLVGRLGKTAVEVNDYPGFVSNRVLMPMINEAIFCVMEGVATPEAVDEVMKLGMAHPLGPLALADLIGLDVCLHILEVLQQGFGDSKYRPCPLLRQMVAAGRLGRKSGRGFFSY